MTETPDALSIWLRTVQGTELVSRQLIDPARARQPVGKIVRDAGGGQEFDTEPSRFHKMLFDLAPQSLKPGKGTS